MITEADILMLERCMQLMAANGVTELRLEDVHVCRPLTPKEQPPRSAAEMLREQNIQEKALDEAKKAAAANAEDWKRGRIPLNGG